MLNRRRSDRNDRNTSSHETSLIARGTVVRGDLYFSGALHLDGRIEGTVQAEGEDAMFTLSEHGQVHGEIRVPQAVINGHVTGDVYCNRVELAPQAHIDGDLRYHTLEMAAGAQINGRISRQPEDAQRFLSAPEVAVSASGTKTEEDDIDGAVTA